MKTPYPNMRDPAGNDQAYDQYFQTAAYIEADFVKSFSGLEPDSKLYRLAYRFSDDQNYLQHQYGAGASIEEISSLLRQRTTRMLDDSTYIREHGGDGQLLFGVERRSFAYLALAMSLMEDDVSAQLSQMVSTAKTQQSYLFDLLVRAFAPQHPVAKKYQVNKFKAPWLDPVVRVLALPPERRPAAMAQHMQNWTRRMRPWGWKPDLNTAPGNDKLFCDFAFEVALAVCAYDIDDSAFNQHPYYPNDLVQHYRTHVRNQRDSWRAQGTGAGLPVIAPAPPPKADLAKRKRKGLARWIELVADGDIDATDAVLEVTGKPRKVKDLDHLMCALAENGVAVHADIKDDEMLKFQVSALGEARGLGIFEGPPGPPYGPARCTATLAAWAAWTAERGYLQTGIDLQDDAWHAVLVRSAFIEEWRQLSEELAIPLLP